MLIPVLDLSAIQRKLTLLNFIMRTMEEEKWIAISPFKVLEYNIKWASDVNAIKNMVQEGTGHGVKVLGNLIYKDELYRRHSPRTVGRLFKGLDLITSYDWSIYLDPTWRETSKRNIRRRKESVMELMSLGHEVIPLTDGYDLRQFRSFIRFCERIGIDQRLGFSLRFERLERRKERLMKIKKLMAEELEKGKDVYAFGLGSPRSILEYRDLCTHIVTEAYRVAATYRTVYDPEGPRGRPRVVHLRKLRKRELAEILDRTPLRSNGLERITLKSQEMVDILTVHNWYVIHALYHG